MTALKALLGAGAVILASHGYHLHRRAREDELMEVFLDMPNHEAFYLARHNTHAAHYDESMDTYEWSKRIHKYRSVLLSYAEGKVLEVGVGTGRNWAYYPRGCRVVGVDWSEEMIKQAKSKDTLLDPDRAIVLTMDARHVDFPDNAFDTVVSTFVLGSSPTPDKLLAEMVRVCRPSGRILLLDRGIGTSLLANTLLEMFRYEYLMEYGYDQCLSIEEVVQKAAVDVEVEEHKQGGQIHFYLLRPRKT